MDLLVGVLVWDASLPLPASLLLFVRVDAAGLLVVLIPGRRSDNFKGHADLVFGFQVIFVIGKTHLLSLVALFELFNLVDSDLSDGIALILAVLVNYVLIGVEIVIDVLVLIVVGVSLNICSRVPFPAFVIQKGLLKQQFFFFWEGFWVSGLAGQHCYWACSTFISLSCWVWVIALRFHYYYILLGTLKWEFLNLLLFLNFLLLSLSCLVNLVLEIIIAFCPLGLLANIQVHVFE